MDVLATIGSGYATALTGIADRAYEIAHYLAGVFIILMIGLAALEAMFGQMHIKPFFFGIAFAMIYVFIMKNALPISEGMVRVPVQIGLRLAGIGGSAADFLASPDKLFYQGMGIVQNLWDAGYETCKDTQFIGCFGGLNMPSPILWAIASVMFGFLIGGVSIFCAAFGIKLIVFLGLIILPMAIFAPTAMFGKGPIRGAMYSCMFLMVLTASLGLTTMAYTRISADATGLYEWGKALPFIGTAVIFAGLILFAHIIAKSVADGGMAVGSALVTGPSGAVWSSIMDSPLIRREISGGGWGGSGGGGGQPSPTGVTLQTPVGGWGGSSGGGISNRQGVLAPAQRQVGWSGRVERT